MPVFLQWRSVKNAGELKRRLVAGDRQFGLYGLRSFVILHQLVQVLVEPHAELPRILCSWQAKQASFRWVASARSYDVIRRIENCPVRAGLAQRPEQWPWSSAWDD